MVRNQVPRTVGESKNVSKMQPNFRVHKEFGGVFSCQRRQVQVAKTDDGRIGSQDGDCDAAMGIQDVGVAIATAHAGLYRMGELTATQGSFNPTEDMSESDLEFLPSFWKAGRVTIRLGRSKADQSGERSKLRPRVLPVDENDPRSPGRLLRDMLAERHSVRKGRAPSLGARPLFQDRRGGQLKQSAALEKLRKALMATGMTKKEAAEFGTHSCRIGGATKLFQLGASPEVIKRMGGWSSEAHRLYVMVQQRDLMDFSRRMCSIPNRVSVPEARIGASGN